MNISLLVGCDQHLTDYGTSSQDIDVPPGVLAASIIENVETVFLTSGGEPNLAFDLATGADSSVLDRLAAPSGRWAWFRRFVWLRARRTRQFPSWSLARPRH
jgi:hypothetical protein